VADEHLPWIEPLRSPWRAQLIEALAHVQHHLLLVGPYIKADVVAMLKDVLAERLTSQPLAVRVITHILPDDFLSGASDIAALQHLLAWPAELPGSTVELRAISNLHAKVWVFDSTLALVGSGNATFSGLQSNLEYGLSISDPSLVERILQDWQGWWEQAAPISTDELEQMRLWLADLADDPDLLLAEKAAQEKRQAVERRIGRAPRIGNRVVVARAVRTKSQLSEPPRPYESVSNTQSNLSAPEASQAASQELAAAIFISADRLWQALSWTTAWLNSTPKPIARIGEYLKISSKPTIQNQHVVQCIWADGNRYSQASILGYASDDVPSWTATLGIRAEQQLATFMKQVQRQGMTDNLALSEYDVAVRWQSSTLNLFFSHKRDSNFQKTIPNMPAVLLSNVAAPHPPLSQLVVEQDALRAGLMSLKQQWEISQPRASALEAIELSFDTPGVTSTLLLSVGPIDAPLLVLLEATDCILGGPEIKLRLDFLSFQHVVMNTPEEVRRWRLKIGGDATAVQFIPEFDSEMAQVESSDWIHELRNVADG
jgi:hypothetical protein